MVDGFFDEMIKGVENFGDVGTEMNVGACSIVAVHRWRVHIDGRVTDVKIVQSVAHQRKRRFGFKRVGRRSRGRVAAARTCCTIASM